MYSYLGTTPAAHTYTKAGSGHIRITQPQLHLRPSLRLEPGVRPRNEDLGTWKADVAAAASCSPGLGPFPPSPVWAFSGVWNSSWKIGKNLSIVRSRQSVLDVTFPGVGFPYHGRVTSLSDQETMYRTFCPGNSFHYHVPYAIKVGGSPRGAYPAVAICRRREHAR